MAPASSPKDNGVVRHDNGPDFEKNNLYASCKVPLDCLGDRMGDSVKRVDLGSNFKTEKK